MTGPDQTRPGRGEILAALAITALALALRLVPMGRGLQGDELWTVVDFVEAPTTWQTLTRVVDFNNHHFYSLLARIAEQLLGRHEWVVRLPALLLGLATIPVLWLGLRRRFGPAIALLTALALAGSSVHIGYSATARGYTGMVLFTWLAGLCFLDLVEQRGGTARVFQFAVLSALALWIHLYAASVLAVQGAVLAILAASAWRRDGVGAALERYRSAAMGLVGAGLLSVLLYAPVLLPLTRAVLGGGSSDFEPGLPLSVLAYLTGHGVGVASGILLLAILVGLRIGLKGRWLEGLYAATLFALPLGFTWLSRPEVVRERFFVFLLPLLALGLGSAAERAWRAAAARLPLRAAAGGLIGLLGWLWAAPPWRSVPRGGHREAVAALEAPPVSPGGQFHTCAIGWRPHLFSWYARQPVRLPQTVAELEAFLSSYDDVRCARFAGSGDSPVIGAMGELLDRRCAAPERYFVILVYRCRRPSPVDGTPSSTDVRPRP